VRKYSGSITVTRMPSGTQHRQRSACHAEQAKQPGFELLAHLGVADFFKRAQDGKAGVKASATHRTILFD
jgi:hypothetical protein